MGKLLGRPAGTLGRRDFLKQTALAGAAMGPLTGLIAGAARPAWADATPLSVFAPLPPDPAPPGDAKFSQDALVSWEQANGAKVNYEAVAWPQLHDKMATNFASGTHVWDVIYMSGWVPEFGSSNRALFIWRMPLNTEAAGRSADSRPCPTAG